MLDICNTLPPYEKRTQETHPQWQQICEVQPKQIAATALFRLWKEQDFSCEPLLFETTSEETVYFPALLNKSIQQGSKRKKSRKGQLLRWERLSPPSYGGGIGSIPLRSGLMEANMLSRATIYASNTVAGPFVDGWFAYHFDGWSALSVRLDEPGSEEAHSIVMLPEGRQDDWLAFQRELRQALYGVLRHKRKKRIDTIGVPGSDYGMITEEIRQATFEHVILSQEIIDQVNSQQMIFQPEILARYAALGIPRLRKILLIGPPGTGKTTLTKAFAASHQRNGGYVIYVFADENIPEHSWLYLRRALRSAVNSGLPTVIIVEDLENFVSEKHMQTILNMLDGVATPDNPAGTLLLATTNAPERIDKRITQRPGRIDIMIEVSPIKDEALAIRFLQRFLHTAYNPQEHDPVARRLIGQVGSHVREVCFLASIHVIEDKRDQVTQGDLIWAHDVLLTGRKAAADRNTCEPPEAKQRAGLGFGSKK